MILHQLFTMQLRTYLYTIISLILLAFAPSAMAQQDEGAYIVTAVGYFNSGDLAGAEAVLKKVLQINPKNDAALYYMAMCHIAQDRADAAEACLDAAIEADSTNFWYRHRLASLYAKTSRPELTIQMYEKLLEDYPKKSELYFDLVELYASQGELEKALNTLSEIETVLGMTESIAVYRYNLLQQLGRGEEAYTSLEQYNSRYSSPYVLAMLAEHQISMYNDSTALAYYDEALELAPEFAPALLGKAETLRMTRKYSEYFDVLKQYVATPEETAKAKSDYITAVLRAMDPKFMSAFSPQIDEVMELACDTHKADSTVLSLAGAYYYTTGRQDRAKDAFRQNVQTNPSSIAANAEYVEFLMYAEMWDELSREGRVAYERFPQELAFLEMASVGDYSLERYDKVLEICDEVLKVAPADSAKTLRAWSTKGDVCFFLGDIKKGYKAYDKALKINPDYVYVLNNYAYFLCLQGKNLKKALAMSAKTIEAEPDNATYLDTYGWILYLLGRPEDAKPHFKRAMMYGGKDSPVIMDHYAEVLFELGEYDRAMMYWNKALLINNGEIKDLEDRVRLRKQQRNSNK